MRLATAVPFSLFFFLLYRVPIGRRIVDYSRAPVCSLFVLSRASSVDFGAVCSIGNDLLYIGYRYISSRDYLLDVVLLLTDWRDYLILVFRKFHKYSYRVSKV